MPVFHFSVISLFAEISFPVQKASTPAPATASVCVWARVRVRACVMLSEKVSFTLSRTKALMTMWKVSPVFPGDQRAEAVQDRQRAAAD